MNRSLVAGLACLTTLIAVAIVGGQEQRAPTLPPSNIKSDEEVLFYPTYGRYDDQAGVWRFDVHGKTFEYENSSRKRAALIAILLTTVNLSIGAEDSAFRDDRIRPFLVDNERGKSVTINIAEQEFIAGMSEANGHFSASLVLNADAHGVTAEQHQTLDVKAVLPSSDSRTFTGRVHLIASHGVSVISDIDDTIKHSQVTDKSELLQNTFLREFRAVEGMPELYARIAELEVAFHYVSGSPWQLYQPLAAFISHAGFPSGTVHLKHFRLTDSSARDLLAPQQETKFAAAKPLLNAFPQRKFILIGDSGEQDPEIYGQLAREHTDQITGIFIRNVTAEKRDDERFVKAFVDVSSDRWALFDDVSLVAEQIIKLAEHATLK
jgi:phosphatidate phosphatase APP1